MLFARSSVGATRGNGKPPIQSAYSGQWLFLAIFGRSSDRISLKKLDIYILGLFSVDAHSNCQFFYPGITVCHFCTIRDLHPRFFLRSRFMKKWEF